MEVKVEMEAKGRSFVPPQYTPSPLLSIPPTLIPTTLLSKKKKQLTHHDIPNDFSMNSIEVGLEKLKGD